jgi:hypothetical protein
VAHFGDTLVPGLSIVGLSLTVAPADIRVSRTGVCSSEGMPMLTPPESPPPAEEPPAWAVRQALSDLPSGSETSVVTALAWHLADAAAERFQERHDEYDDPDQGGEA